ncbi:hypothetical protein ACPSKX_19305 [Moritella viscosa]
MLGIFSWEIDGDGNGDILHAMNQAVNNPQGQTDWSGSIITNEAPSISIAFPSGSVVHTEGDTAQFSALITDDKLIATVDVTVNGVTKAVIQDATTYSGSFVVTLGSNTVIFKATDNEGVLSQKTITIIGNAKDLVCEDGSSVVNGECAVDPIVCEEGSSLVDGKCVADEVVTETPFVAGSTKASNGKVYSYQGLCYQAKNSPGAWEVPTVTSWFWTPVTCSGSIITNEAPSISIASPSGSVVHTEGDTAQFSALITDDKLIATVDVTVNGVTKAVIQDATTYSGSFVVTLGSNTVIFKATDNEGVLSQKTITIIGNAKGLVCEDGSSVVNGECVVDEVVSETPFVAGSTMMKSLHSLTMSCTDTK